MASEDLLGMRPLPGWVLQTRNNRFLPQNPGKERYRVPRRGLRAGLLYPLCTPKPRGMLKTMLKVAHCPEWANP